MKKRIICVILSLGMLAMCLGLSGCSSGSYSSNSKTQKEKTLVTGTCSHCHGSGFTSYGSKCRWCDGYGVWSYYK